MLRRRQRAGGPARPVRGDIGWGVLWSWALDRRARDTVESRANETRVRAMLDGLLKTRADFGQPCWVFTRGKDAETGAGRWIVLADMVAVSARHLSRHLYVGCPCRNSDDGAFSDLAL